MPSKGETRRSHSVTLFNTFRKDGECSKQSSRPLSKRQREGNENPIILVNRESTATLVEETINEGKDFVSPPMFVERKKEQMALKLNRLKNKYARTKNQKQEFLDNWYTKLKDFSLILMKYIVLKEILLRHH